MSQEPQDVEAVGRAAHEAWKRWRVEHGYPDHALVGQWINYAERDDCYWGCAVCGKKPSDHHDDTVPWDDLPPEKREKYQRMAEAGAAVERARWRVLLKNACYEWQMTRDALSGVVSIGFNRVRYHLQGNLLTGFSAELGRGERILADTEGPTAEMMSAIRSSDERFETQP